MTKKIIAPALCFMLASCCMTPVFAQQFNNVPDKSVIGRIGTGNGSGPAQAIPFTTLMAQIGALNPTFGVPGQSAGSACFASATSGSVCIAGATGALGSSVATLPAGTYNIVGDNVTQTLTNKTIDNTVILTVKSASFTLQDSSDPTKQVKFNLSSLTTATTRTYQVPNANTTLVGINTADTLSNKTLDNTTSLTAKAANVTLQDASDTTKQAKFDISALTTATTRTYSMPNASTTLVGANTADTLSNKTFDSASNTLKVGGVTVSPGQYPGEPSNGAATAGNVGELISANVVQGSAVALTSATIANVTSIALTAGDWDIFAEVGFIPGGTTTITRWGGSIETANNIFSSVAPNSVIWSMGSFTPGANANLFNVGPLRVSLSAGATYYLNAVSTFATSTNAAFGTIRARRVR